MDNSNFQFQGFSIKKSFIEISDESKEEDLTVKFGPSGVLDKTKNEFKLTLEVIVSGKTVDIHIVSEGNFIYENLSDEVLGSFLLLNAPAILFPYLRAYISTLTNLSGISPLTLPTLNLVALKPMLEENIEVIEA